MKFEITENMNSSSVALLLLLQLLSFSNSVFAGFVTEKINATGGASGMNFGNSVRLSGEFLGVTALNHLSNQGSVFLYRCGFRSSSQCEEELVLNPTNGCSNCQFGTGMDMVQRGDDLILLVGQRHTTGPTTGKNGAAFLFQCDTTTSPLQCEQAVMFTGDGGNIFDIFGGVVVIEENMVAIGAPGTVGDSAFIGWVAIYECPLTFTANDNDQCEFRQKLIGTGSGTRFGSSIAAHPGALVVSEPNTNSNAGQVLFYHCSDLSAANPCTLKNTLIEMGTRFLGRSLALQGEWLFAGSPGTNTDTGTIFLFHCEDYSVGCVFHSTLTPSGATNNMRFGITMRVDTQFSLAVTSCPTTSGIVTVYLFDCSSLSTASPACVEKHRMSPGPSSDSNDKSPSIDLVNDHSFVVGLDQGKVGGVAMGAAHLLYCEAGYAGGFCTECDTDLYGSTCSNNCNVCNQHGTCYPGVAGNCTCNANWQGAECDQCISDRFGKNCDLVCSQCTAHGSIDLPCQTPSGKCICSGNFQGDVCNACIDGYYGAQCAYSCVVCEEHGTCTNGTNGFCECDALYSGVTCSTEVTCKTKPDLCENGGSCDTKTGVCQCAEGFEGKFCTVFTGILGNSLTTPMEALLYIVAAISLPILLVFLFYFGAFESSRNAAFQFCVRLMALAIKVGTVITKIFFCLSIARQANNYPDVATTCMVAMIVFLVIPFATNVPLVLWKSVRLSTRPRQKGDYLYSAYAYFFASLLTIFSSQYFTSVKLISIGYEAYLFKNHGVDFKGYKALEEMYNNRRHHHKTRLFSYWFIPFLLDDVATLILEIYFIAVLSATLNLPYLFMICIGFAAVSLVLNGVIFYAWDVHPLLFSPSEYFRDQSSEFSNSNPGSNFELYSIPNDNN